MLLWTHFLLLPATEQLRPYHQLVATAPSCSLYPHTCLTCTASAALLSHPACTRVLQRKHRAKSFAPSGGHGCWQTPHLSSTWGIMSMSISPVGLAGSSLTARAMPADISMLPAASKCSLPCLLLGRNLGSYLLRHLQGHTRDKLPGAAA